MMVLAAIFLGGVVLLTWPVRFLIRKRKRGKAYAKSQVDRVVILGFDGMDPEIVDRMLAEGKLPNLARLRDTGTYTRLATTCPAMSPVAWSSFMTGAGPGRHGIFDFLTRDPQTYLPDLSSAQIRPPRRVLKLGGLRLPLSRPTLRLLRRSKPFWTVLGEHGIFSTVLRVPITFPPERFHGLLLSGMCAPDLRGTQGSFAFFTTADGVGERADRRGAHPRCLGERVGARRAAGAGAVVGRGGGGNGRVLALSGRKRRGAARDLRTAREARGGSVLGLDAGALSGGAGDAGERDLSLLSAATATRTRTVRLPSEH